MAIRHRLGESSSLVYNVDGPLKEQLLLQEGNQQVDGHHGHGVATGISAIL